MTTTNGSSTQRLPPAHYPVLIDPDGDEYHINIPDQYSENGMPQTDCSHVESDDVLSVCSRRFAENHFDLVPCDECFSVETDGASNGVFLPGGAVLTPTEGRTYETEPDLLSVVMWRQNGEGEADGHSIPPSVTDAEEVVSDLRDAGHDAWVTTLPRYQQKPAGRSEQTADATVKGDD